MNTNYFNYIAVKQRQLFIFQKICLLIDIFVFRYYGMQSFLWTMLKLKCCSRHLSVEMETEVFPLTDLPKELLEYVFTFLPGKDLLQVYSRVNKEWKEIIRSQSLWRIKCERLKILFDDLYKHTDPDYAFDYLNYFFNNPYTRNLLKNAKALGNYIYTGLFCTNVVMTVFDTQNNIF